MRMLLTVAALSAALLTLVAEPVQAGGRRSGGCSGGSCGGGYSGGSCAGGYCGGGCAGGSCGGGVAMGGCVGGSCGGTVVAGLSGSGTVVAGLSGGCPGGVCQISPAVSGTATVALSQQPAQLVVNLPVGATLTIDGYVSKSTAAERLFTTPALEVGKTFTYSLKATVERDGKPETVTRQVAVRGGEQTHVALDFNTTVAADE
jgi:uncharacterized protein (TIGR03000 family)